jgi:DNA-binding Lrp family transcriptional regulator
MDDLDREIVAQLEADGRLSLTDLAARAGLTVSTAHRRVRELERSGVIRGYRALIDPASVGLSFEVLVYFTTKQGDAAVTLHAFEEALANVPGVHAAYRLFGDPDYLAHIRTASLEAFVQLEDNVLMTLPGVQRLSSTLIMKNLLTE